MISRALLVPGNYTTPEVPRNCLGATSQTIGDLAATRRRKALFGDTYFNECGAVVSGADMRKMFSA
jgi:hypothetical protein